MMNAGQLSDGAQDGQVEKLTPLQMAGIIDISYGVNVISFLMQAHQYISNYLGMPSRADDHHIHFRARFP